MHVRDTVYVRMPYVCGNDDVTRTMKGPVSLRRLAGLRAW